MQINNAQLTAIISNLQARHATPDTATLEQAIATWEVLARKFGTLVGQDGVNLIFGRSLDRVRPHYPWLPPSKQTQLTSLQDIYSQQSAADAVAANSALFDAFINLLATLIGAGLTVQFLRSAFVDDGAAPNQMET
jgi:hypothetical protein